MAASAGNDDILENHYMRYFLGAHIAGVLVQPMASVSWKPSLEVTSVPTVYLDVHTNLITNYVAAYNEEQGRLILKHALSCGARKVADVMCSGMWKMARSSSRRFTASTTSSSAGAVMRCVYESLTSCYAQSISELSELTGRTYTSLNVVGGGCQDAYLNDLTARACGLPVFAGPIEGTSLGNLMVQMIQGGEFADLEEARAAISRSFDVKTHLPN